MTSNNPQCLYCKEHHNPNLACPSYVKQDELLPCGVRDIKVTECPLREKKLPQLFGKMSKIPEKKIAYCVAVANGKYCVVSYENGGMEAFRYCKKWQDLTGNNLVFNLMVELIQAQEKIKAATNCLVCVAIADVSEVIENTMGILENKEGK